LPAGRTPANHPTDYRRPHPRRPLGECRVSRRQGRIAELEDKLARAEIIDVSKLSGDTITFGATVTLIDEDTEKKAVWQLVGEPEADAKKGKISITSPLARALVGKKKGASVEVVTPGGAKAYEVMKVEWK
jgi:transcription elongation factor GreA